MSQAHAECSDEMLMVRYKRGDRDAFAELVRRYQRPLFNFSLRYLGRRETASEVTQEAFLRVVKRSGDFKHESRFSTWLFSITRNLCVDELRKHKHRDHASLDEPLKDGTTRMERLALEGGEHTRDAERNSGNMEIRDCIVSALDGLPHEQREVFLLRHLGGVPFAEIARITETNENTVKSRMRYALEQLQSQLSDFEEYARALR